MNWDDLRILEAASRADSLAALARDLGFDPTTVSRRLKQIEERLEVTLFERTRGRLVLTPQARRLVRHLGGMRDAASAVLGEARSLRDAPEGSVAVSAPPTLARHVIAPAMSQLAARAPRVTLDLQVRRTNVRLDHLEADIAVRMGSPADTPESTRTRRVGMLSYAVFTSARGEEDGWIAYPEAFADLPETTWVHAQLAGAAPVMRGDDPAAMAAAVASGAGQALLPVIVGASITGLVQQGPPVLHRDIHLLRRPEPERTSATALVYEWLVECFAVWSSTQRSHGNRAHSPPSD